MSGRKKNFLRPLHLLSFTLILGTVLILVLTALVQFRRSPGRSDSFLVTEPPPVIQEHPIQEQLSCPEVPSSASPALENAEESVQSPFDGRINLLLIGQDTRESGSRARSDAMILCSLHPEKQTITLISFLRDLYVQIPGYSHNRLNAAYAFGGMELLKQTFSQNFGIHVDGCIEVDFQQFIRLVDLMGGITLSLRQDEAALLNQLCGCSALAEGSQQLDGQQALAYARIRNLDSDGDFSRTHRQRKLLTALLQQLRKCSVREALSLLASANDLVSTDLTISQITAYAVGLLPLLSDMGLEQLRIPADGAYTPRNIDGMEVLVADARQTETVLRAALGEE